MESLLAATNSAFDHQQQTSPSTTTTPAPAQQQLTITTTPLVDLTDPTTNTKITRELARLSDTKESSPPRPWKNISPNLNHVIKTYKGLRQQYYRLRSIHSKNNPSLPQHQHYTTHDMYHQMGFTDQSDLISLGLLDSMIDDTGIYDHLTENEINELWEFHEKFKKLIREKSADTTIVPAKTFPSIKRFTNSTPSTTTISAMEAEIDETNKLLVQFQAKYNEIVDKSDGHCRTSDVLAYIGATEREILQVRARIFTRTTRVTPDEAVYQLCHKQRTEIQRLISTKSPHYMFIRDMKRKVADDGDDDEDDDKDEEEGEIVVERKKNPVGRPPKKKAKPSESTAMAIVEQDEKDGDHDGRDQNERDIIKEFTHLDEQMEDAEKKIEEYKSKIARLTDAVRGIKDKRLAVGIALINYRKAVRVLRDFTTSLSSTSPVSPRF